MRIAGVLWAICVLGQSATAEEAFPHTATVSHEAVLVRSGPGESFYPTCRLLKGAEVEVHRKGPNGWCAIRPPEGEFCLIAAGRVKLLPGDDLAEVVDQEATVWIGSHVAKPDPHRWQIHLQPGERAAVLGVRAGAGEAGNAAAWYKIAPPAGEFRWVPLEALKREVDSSGEAPPQQLSAEAVASAQPLADPTAADETPEPPISDVLPMPAGEQTAGDQPAAESPNETVAQASLESHSEGEPPLSPIPDEAAHQMPSEPALPVAPPFREADLRIEPKPRVPRDESAATATLPDVAIADTPFDIEATALQVDLTLAVAHDLSRWRLGPLRDRAERLRDNAPSPECRQQAESLLASIERFEQLYDRYREYALGASPPGRPARHSSSATRTARFSGTAEDNPVAASGQLAPVSAEVDSPPFALLDDEGRIEAYVTPGRGVDLMRFAEQHIGVYGAKTTDERLRAPHVIARAVKPLTR